VKVVIINSNPQYQRMFQDRGWEVMPVTIENIQNADLVQFTGGSDVTPALYGEKNTASDNSEPRDLMEIGVFGVAMAEDIPMAGICRGGQFLNVMCGGKMIQHIVGHATGRTHPLFQDSDDGIPIKVAENVTSTHHQAIVTPQWGGNILAYGPDGVTEVVYYEDYDVLCFQPHPEFGPGECQDLYFKYLEELFFS
jgi:gamma-glutamyl-gamma-aminobutyrate hydrolase PuuD